MMTDATYELPLAQADFRCPGCGKVYLKSTLYFSFLVLTDGPYHACCGNRFRWLPAQEDGLISTMSPLVF